MHMQCLDMITFFFFLNEHLLSLDTVFSNDA